MAESDLTFDNGPTLFECIDCEDSFNNKSDLEDHISSRHHEEDSLGCSECEFVAKSIQKLSEHMVTHSEITSFTCRKCQKEFSTKNNLTKHTKAKHDKVVYPCNKCDYKAKHNFLLKSHNRTKH